MYEQLKDINLKYDGQWVYLIDCQEDEYGAVVGGRVVLSSESRDKVIREMSSISKTNTLTSFRYAGKIPEGVKVIL